MYKPAQPQMTLYDYVPPFEGRLEPTNRWFRFAEALDWDGVEAEYSAHFRPGGKAAISARAAFGSLVIREVLGLSDGETVQQIRENPYLQYFLGSRSFAYASPVSVRSMARFRRRIPPEAVRQAAELFEQLQKQAAEPKSPPK